MIHCPVFKYMCSQCATHLIIFLSLHLSIFSLFGWLPWTLNPGPCSSHWTPSPASAQCGERAWHRMPFPALVSFQISRAVKESTVKHVCGCALVLLVFDTNSHSVSLNGLALTMLLRLALNLWQFTCFSLTNAGITSMSYTPFNYFYLSDLIYDYNISCTI